MPPIDIIDEYNSGMRDFSCRDLIRANLSGANLRYANLSGANLRDADLRRADLRDADLRRADLTGANLRYANLSGANLRDADLRRADLDFSCLPLWCGSFNMKVDKRIAVQIAYHLCALECDDPEFLDVRSKCLEFAKQMHRTDVFEVVE